METASLLAMCHLLAPGFMMGDAAIGLMPSSTGVVKCME